jgi:hypothetical protein
MARKYKATYPSGKTKTVLANSINNASDKLFKLDGKLKYRTLQRVNPLKKRKARKK